MINNTREGRSDVRRLWSPKSTSPTLPSKRSNKSSSAISSGVFGSAGKIFVTMCGRRTRNSARRSTIWSATPSNIHRSAGPLRRGSGVTHVILRPPRRPFPSPPLHSTARDPPTPPPTPPTPHLSPPPTYLLPLLAPPLPLHPSPLSTHYTLPPASPPSPPPPPPLFPSYPPSPLFPIPTLILTSLYPRPRRPDPDTGDPDLRRGAGQASSTRRIGPGGCSDVQAAFGHSTPQTRTAEIRFETGELVLSDPGLKKAIIELHGGHDHVDRDSLL